MIHLVICLNTMAFITVIKTVYILGFITYLDIPVRDLPPPEIRISKLFNLSSTCH